MRGFQQKQLVDTRYLDEILGSFSEATGLHTEAVDNDGKAFFIPGNLDRCRFCKIIRSSPEGEERCRKSYQQASLEAAKWEEPYFFRCHAGLVIWAVPIIINGTSAGSIICGQVLLWEPDKFFWTEIENLNEGNPDLEKLKEAATELEVVSPQRTQAAAELLFVAVNHMVKRNALVLQEIEESKRIQQQIRMQIEKRKLLPKEYLLNYDAYLKTERKLLRYIRMGDKTRADKALCILLTDLYTKSHGDINEIRVRILELISLVSRAAVEGGADADRAMDSLKHYNFEINRLTKMEDMFYQAKRVVESFLKEIFALTDKKYMSLVKRAREYIMENYNKPLKIEDIAEHLFISPSHLSRLFRQELDCTVLEYLTRVRVEEAVELLKKQEFSIEEVAKAVGFKNQSYFTKVFKKYIGLTPLMYRNSLF